MGQVEGKQPVVESEDSVVNPSIGYVALARSPKLSEP